MGIPRLRLPVVSLTSVAVAVLGLAVGPYPTGSALAAKPPPPTTYAWKITSASVTEGTMTWNGQLVCSYRIDVSFTHPSGGEVAIYEYRDGSAVDSSQWQFTGAGVSSWSSVFGAYDRQKVSFGVYLGYYTYDRRTRTGTYVPQDQWTLDNGGKGYTCTLR